MTNKEKYRKLCDEKAIPLFMQAWWLDAVTLPENKKWDVILYEEKGDIVAAMPYHFLKKWGFRIILQPQLTQYSGVWIDYPENVKLHKRYSFEQRIMDNLIDRLEEQKMSFYSQNFHHSVSNWQPFYWRGFRQTTRYTYQLKDLSDLDQCFKNFSSAKQRHIKKEKFDLQIDFSLSAADFYNFHRKTLTSRSTVIEYSQKLFLSIYNEAINREQGKIIALKDKNNNLHAALFFVWDKNTAYALTYAINPRFKNNGTSTKMFWEAIKYVSEKTKTFDFEGSMIERVADSYRQFGTTQIPYFNVSKSYSCIFDLLFRLKNGKN